MLSPQHIQQYPVQAAEAAQCVEVCHGNMGADISHSANGGVSLQGNVLGVIQTDSHVKWEAGVAVAETTQCLFLNQSADCSSAQLERNLKSAMCSAHQPTKSNLKQI